MGAGGVVYTHDLLEKKGKGGTNELVRNMQTKDALCTYQRDMVHRILTCFTSGKWDFSEELF